MEISQSLLIETAWIAGGYLGVIAFGLVLFLMARRPAGKPTTQEKKSAAKVEETSSKQIAAPPSQYVPLTTMHRPAEPIRTADSIRAAGPIRPAGVTSLPATAHRNRQEVLRVARQMLTAGAPHNRIQAVLPVSTAELTLLEQTNK